MCFKLTFNLPSMTNIVTSVNTSVPCKGNGNTLGLVVNQTNTGLSFNNNGVIMNRDTYYNKPVTTAWTAMGNEATNGLVGITTDASKSGIVGTVTRTSITCKYCIKY